MHFRSIFISDVHLGAKHSKADELAVFFSENTCDKLYMVGDILDFWKIKNSCYFPRSHVNIIRKILNLSEKGTEVYYIIGNHDELLRQYIPMKFGNIKMVDEMVHQCLNGKQLLVIHGDQFDPFMAKSKWLMKFGDFAYNISINVNSVVHFTRTRFGYKYWSFSQWTKTAVKSAVQFVSRYEKLVSDSVKDRGLDGVVCGHIHHPEIKIMNGIQYINCGDWVETCSVVTEDYDSNLKLHFYYKP